MPTTAVNEWNRTHAKTLTFTRIPYERRWWQGMRLVSMKSKDNLKVFFSIWMPTLQAKGTWGQLKIHLSWRNPYIKVLWNCPLFGKMSTHQGTVTPCTSAVVSSWPVSVSKARWQRAELHTSMRWAMRPTTEALSLEERMRGFQLRKPVYLHKLKIKTKIKNPVNSILLVYIFKNRQF